MRISAVILLLLVPAYGKGGSKAGQKGPQGPPAHANAWGNSAKEQEEMTVQELKDIAEVEEATAEALVEDAQAELEVEEEKNGNNAGGLRGVSKGNRAGDKADRPKSPSQDGASVAGVEASGDEPKPPRPGHPNFDKKMQEFKAAKAAGVEYVKGPSISQSNSADDKASADGEPKKPREGHPQFAKKKAEYDAAMEAKAAKDLENLAEATEDVVGDLEAMEEGEDGQDEDDQGNEDGQT